MTARSFLRAVVASAVALAGILAIVLVSALFSETGTRWLLSQLGDYTPVVIEYDNGTLSSGLYLHNAMISLDGLDVRMEEVALALSPSCLWNSRICLSNLSARHVEVRVRDTEQEQSAEEPDVSSEPFKFPFAISAPSIALDSLLVTWPGGTWRNQRLIGAVNIIDEELRVDQLEVDQGGLELQAAAKDDAASYPFAPPDIELPFTLIVDNVTLTQGSYDFYGQSGTLSSLTLAGEWSGHTVSLETLALTAEKAELDLSGSLRMRDAWWLQASAEATLPKPLPSDPLGLDRLNVDLEGALAQLGWDAVLESTEPASNLPAMIVQLAGEVDLTQDQLPLSIDVLAEWQGDLSVKTLLPDVALMEEVTLRSPLQGSVTGDLQQQRVLLELGASGMGYDALTFSLQSVFAQSQLTLESLSVVDEGSNTAIQTSGTINFDEGVDVVLAVESGGLQLPTISEEMSGRIDGSATLAGFFQSDQWRLSLSDIALQGTVNQLPAQIAGAVSMSSERLLESANLDGKLKGAVVRIRSAGDSKSLGTLELQIDDVGMWIPDATGKVRIAATTDPQTTRLTLSGDGEQLSYGSTQLRAMQFDGSLALERRWFESFSIKGTELDIAGQEIVGWQANLQHHEATGIDRLLVTTQGDIGLAVTLEGQGGLDDWKGALQPTEVAFSQSALSLQQAVELHWIGAQDQLTVDAHCWRIGETQACFENAVLGPSGLVNGRVNGDLRFLADLFPHQVAVEGLLSGSLAGRWSPGTAPALQLNITGRDVAITQSLGAGQQARLDWNLIQVDLTTGLDASSAQVRIQRAGQDKLNMDANLSGWGEDALLSGSIKASNLLLHNIRPFLPRMAELMGEVSGRGQLSGTLGRPEMVGSFALEQGRFAVVGNPTTLSDVSLAVELEGRQAQLNGNGSVGEGALVLSGMAALDPQPRLALNVKGDRKNLMLPPSGQALVSQDLNLVATASGVEVRGQIIVHEGRLEHEQLPEGSVDISADAVEVDYAGNLVSEEKPFDVKMDVGIKIEDRFHVVGTNIDATVGGELRLLQPSNEPLQLFGNLNVIGGELRAYGQSLKIKRGTVSFAGVTDNPQLDLRAERIIILEDIEVGIHVIGPLEEPELEIYSNPAMSKTESLSYLLRGRGLDAGAGGDGTAVALSLGTSIVNQSGVTDSLNKIPGLNNIGFGAEGTADETAATVSGYIGERIYVSYGVGLYEPINILTARLYLQTRLWLEVVSRLENSVDLYYSFDID
ncbi:MAG: translocation/assembly module TamB domain-containing protein [Halioglobus sp.]